MNADCVGFEITPIRLSHVAALRRAFDAVARERRFLAAFEAPSLDETRRYVEERMACGDPMVVAIGADALVGWCDIGRNSAPSRKHRGLLGMGVIADWRRQGVGAALLTAALDLASRRDFIRIELDVHADNAAAIALYEKFGFVREGVQCDGALIDGRFVDVVLMGRVDRVAGG
jgi:RimJ/RimL family protein N-acetyltransferase